MRIYIGHAKKTNYIHKSGKKIAGSIKAITNNIYEYNNTGEMIKIIKDIVEGRKNER